MDALSRAIASNPVKITAFHIVNHIGPAHCPRTDIRDEVHHVLNLLAD